MNPRVALAAALLVALSSATARAAAAPARGGAGGRELDAKAAMERNKKCMRELSAQAAKVTFDRKDVEKYLAEWESFEELDLAGDDAEDDDAGPDCVDLGAALADPQYVAWARERGVEPRSWLLKSLRISLTHAKRHFPAQAAEMKAQLESQRRELTKHCKSMGPDACRDMDKGFVDAEAASRDLAAMMASLPEPSRAEAALLTEYDARLAEAMGGRRGGDDPGMEPEPEGDDEE